MKKRIANVNDDSPLDWRMELKDMQELNQIHAGYKFDKSIYNGPSESSVDI